MSKDERKEMIENIAERFTQMDDVDNLRSIGITEVHEQLV